jgi:predicted secreted protein
MLIGLLVLAQAAAAPAATPPQTAATAPPAQQKLICHLETDGPSRIPQRICHTKAEWDQIERDSQQSFDDNMAKYKQGYNPE